MRTEYTEQVGESLPNTPRPSRPQPVDAATGDGQTDLLSGDFYMEGTYLVFTEQYHLRRGYCCNSDCRHCPYR